MATVTEVRVVGSGSFDVLISVRVTPGQEGKSPMNGTQAKSDAPRSVGLVPKQSEQSEPKR